MSRTERYRQLCFYKKVILLGPASQSHFQRNATKKYFPVVPLRVPWRVILNLIKISEPVAVTEQ